MSKEMETLFQELLDKGLIEIVRLSPNFTSLLAGTVSYQFEEWDIAQMIKDNWRWQ